MVLQSELAECGLACLAMIAGYHGQVTDLSSMRRQHQSSLKGMTLAELTSIADHLELDTRAVRIEPEHLRDKVSPCILHWDLNHFVVLKSASANGIVIHDPAHGVKQCSWKEVGKRFTGVALELNPRIAFKRGNQSTRFSVWQLVAGFRGTKRSAFHALSLSLLLQLFVIASPLYLQTVVDSVLMSDDEDLLSLLAVGFVGLVVIQAMVSALRSSLILSATQRFGFQLSSNLFSHLLRLPLSFFERRHVGDIASRFQSLDRIRDQITSGAIEALIDGLMVIVTLCMMAYYSPLLSAIVVTALTLYSLSKALSFRALQQHTETHLDATARRDTSFLETLRGMQAVKVFNCSVTRQAIWQTHSVSALNAALRVGLVRVGQSLSNQLIFGIESIVVIYAGALAVMSGTLSVGMLMAFIAYKTQFVQRSVSFIDRWQQFRSLRLHLDRVADIALADIEKEPGSDVVVPENVVGRIELCGVGYRHSEMEPFLFRDVSIVIEAGDNVAIVGPSGSGKTTLLKVLMGLLRPTEGRVLIDGCDIRNYPAEVLRHHVAAVMQEDCLFSGSISENISLFDEQLDQQRVEEAAKTARLHATVQSMPMGYESLIGDLGHALSGGQRQRLLLARAIYRKPQVLFLDEATSHLDPALEAEVCRQVEGMKITRIIVAHRRETIQAAGRILVLKGGRLFWASKESYNVPNAQHVAPLRVPL